MSGMSFQVRWGTAGLSAQAQRVVCLSARGLSSLVSVQSRSVLSPAQLLGTKKSNWCSSVPTFFRNP